MEPPAGGYTAPDGHGGYIAVPAGGHTEPDGHGGYVSVPKAFQARSVDLRGVNFQKLFGE